jgi:hypothetical protein
MVEIEIYWGSGMCKLGLDNFRSGSCPSFQSTFESLSSLSYGARVLD